MQDGATMFRQSSVPTSKRGQGAVFTPRDERQGKDAFGVSSAAMLREMVEAYSRALHRKAVRLAGRTQDAEDLVQETYLRAWRSLHTFVPGTNSKAWLSRILRNTYIDRMRAESRRISTVSELISDQLVRADLDTPETLVSARLIEADLQRALMALPDSFRQCIIHVDLRGRSYLEAARALGVPVGTVMSRLHRARAAIRRALKPDPPVTERGRARQRESRMLEWGGRGRTILTVALMLIWGMIVSPSSAWSEPTPLDRAASITFPLYVDADNGKQRACTGFYARPAAVNGRTGEAVAGWVLTAGHCVVHGAVAREMGGAVYEEGHPAVGSWTTGFDFGVLILRDSPGPSRRAPTYLPFLDRPLVMGERLFVIGFGRGQLRNIVGTYGGTDALGVHIKTLEAVRGGMSGSPVITWDGKVAGILVATRCKSTYMPMLGCEDDAYDAMATPMANVVQALHILEPVFFAPPQMVWPSPR
jgi:RNA polymerase sigma-70 factor, ECF subfamily